MNSAPIISMKIHPLKWWMTCSVSILVLIAFSYHTHAEEPKRIIKWKDDKGVTQYGDKIPAQYSNRENSVINKQGITVKRNKPYVYHDPVADQVKIEQDKKDRALLSAFTHESEIDMARDRHLQLDLVTLEGLHMQKANNQKRLVDTKKYASSFVTKKKPVPADIEADIKAMQLEIAKLDQQIGDRKAVMENTRKRFDEDKSRYVELKYPGSVNTEPAPVSPIPSATAPKP